jgi:hypothetical protein
MRRRMLSSDRDELADCEVAAILAELPRDHLALRAFMRGRATVEICNHLRDRRELVTRLMNVCWDCYRRTAPRQRTGRPPPLY